MRGVVGYLFLLSTMASLGLFVGVAFLWTRSYRVLDRVEWIGSTRPGPDNRVVTRRWLCVTSDGGLWFDRHVARIGFRNEAVEHGVIIDGLGHQALPPQGYPPIRSTRVWGQGVWTDGWVALDALGFGLAFTHVTWSPETPRDDRHVTVRVPLWTLAFVSLVLPAIRLLFRARRRLHENLAVGGFCPSCGYDLRASPQRCPECGRGTQGVKTDEL
jgi:hypothetical protein